MTVALSGLTQIATINGGANSRFTYHTADAIATVVAANYFGTIAKDANLRSGDIIEVVDTATPTVDVIVINAVDQDAETNTVVNGT